MEVDDNHLVTILKKLKRLQRFKMTTMGTLFLNRCGCLRGLRDQRKNKVMERLFNRGVKRIETALDIRTLLKTNLESRILA